ncbi:kaptin-like [Sinocyclocheilus anshuiensis]|uniref:kaptin-like n=1 Tax=Sinocyclocheilus anshuiensis TaxID=1608454 RepID=UPI0007B8A87B|nr:PREDICTED: kaptin-like [Sinocyclocheilus anshuiensis]
MAQDQSYAFPSTLRAVHVPGYLNSGVDLLLRQSLEAGEWRLHPQVSNIYGLCKADEQELLPATLKGKVVCFRYQDLQKKIRPVAREIQFTYIPGFHPVDRKLSEPGAPVHTVPALSHRGALWRSSETVFLLSGHDQRIQLYKENASLHQFEEQPVERLFPELQELPSNVLWLNVLSIEQNRRLTAFGCQNGSVGLSLVNQKGPEILQNWRVKHESPICTVLLFPSKQQHQSTDTNSSQRESFHLLVTSAIEMAVVYRDVERYGLSRQLCLAESDQCDAVLCALVVDLDFDGQHELLLGTYG